MRGIEKALADRADIEAAARRSQELWLACQTLQSVLRSTGDADFSLSWEERLKPLLPEISAITSAAPDNVPLMTAVMSSMSAVALSRGVWTEESLVERFARVNTVARRVAFVGEGKPSLFRYALSYFLSFFVFRQPISQDIDAEIPVNNLTPFFLLDRAEESLERGNLELAVRYVNQLTGEPRRIAADWLREARLLLETRQVADVLLAYATATNLGSLG